MRNKATGLLLEFVQLRNTKEAAAIVSEELVPGRANFATVVEAWFSAAFEKKEVDRAAFKVPSLLPYSETIPSNRSFDYWISTSEN